MRNCFAALVVVRWLFCFYTVAGQACRRRRWLQKLYKLSDFYWSARGTPAARFFRASADGSVYGDLGYSADKIGRPPKGSFTIDVSYLALTAALAAV